MKKKREFPNSKATGAQKQNDRGFNSTDLLKNWTPFTFIGLIDTVPVPILISP